MERLDLSQELARDILAMAKAKGASHADIVMVDGESFFVWADPSAFAIATSSFRSEVLGLR